MVKTCRLLAMKNLLCFAALALAFSAAQSSDPIIDWLTRLQAIQANLRRLSGTEGDDLSRAAADLRAVRRAVVASSAAIPLPEPAAGGDRAALLAEAAALRAALEERLRQQPGTPFHLARIEVNVTAEVEQLSTASTLDESEYRRRDLRTIPDALNLTPGVSIQRVGPRNERGVFIRGFDMRQVPLYIDGIPVYVPYDGYADMDRFLTYDVGEM